MAEPVKTNAGSDGQTVVHQLDVVFHEEAEDQAVDVRHVGRVGVQEAAGLRTVGLGHGRPVDIRTIVDAAGILVGLLQIEFAAEPELMCMLAKNMVLARFRGDPIGGLLEQIIAAVVAVGRPVIGRSAAGCEHAAINFPNAVRGVVELLLLPVELDIGLVEEVCVVG